MEGSYSLPRSATAAAATATVANTSRFASIKNFFSRSASTATTPSASWRGRIMSRLPSLTLPSKQTAIIFALIIAVGYLLKKVNELSSKLKGLKSSIGTCEGAIHGTNNWTREDIKAIARTVIPAATPAPISQEIVNQSAQRAIYSDGSQNLIMQLVHKNTTNTSPFSTALDQKIATATQKIANATQQIIATAVARESQTRNEQIQLLQQTVNQNLAENTKTATQELKGTVTTAIKAERAERDTAITAAVQPLSQQIQQMSQTQADLSTQVKEVNTKLQSFIDASVLKVKGLMGAINLTSSSSSSQTRASKLTAASDDDEADEVDSVSTPVTSPVKTPSESKSNATSQTSTKK